MYICKPDCDLLISGCAAQMNSLCEPTPPPPIDSSTTILCGRLQGKGLGQGGGQGPGQASWTLVIYMRYPAPGTPPGPHPPRNGISFRGEKDPTKTPGFREAKRAQVGTRTPILVHLRHLSRTILPRRSRLEAKIAQDSPTSSQHCPR